MNARRLLVALCLSLALIPSVALADVSDADRATARTLALEGYEALQKNDYETALDRFSRADALVHAPTLLIGVARAQVGLGKWIEAQETYNRILREGAAPGSPEPFFKALEDARKELDALTPRIPAVIIEVKGPHEAVVKLDGKAVPSAALGVKRPVNPGEHTILAGASGYVPEETTVKVEEGKVEQVTLELQAPGAPPPIALGPVQGPRVDSPSGGDRVSAGGKGAGWSTQKTLGVVALGVGGAGLVLGAVTGIVAIGKKGELTDVCPNRQCPLREQSNLDSYHTMGTLSTVGFVIGGLGAAAGAALLLTAPKAAPRQEAWIRPILGAGYVGATGRF